MISRLFLDHPRSVNESYFQHMAFASWFAAKLLKAAFAAIIHALFPCCFEKTASGIIAELYERTHRRDTIASATRPSGEPGTGLNPPGPFTRMASRAGKSGFS